MLGYFNFFLPVFPKLECTKHPMICQEYIILLPHTFLILLWFFFHPKWSHSQYFPKSTILICLSNIRPKITLHCKLLGLFLVVTYVPPGLVHPIIPHEKRKQLVHINLYQVTFILCWPCRYLIDKNTYLMNLSISIFIFMCALCSTPSDPPWFPTWIIYHFLFLFTNIILILYFFITWTINTWVTIGIYIWKKSRHWFILLPSVFIWCLVGPYSYHFNKFFEDLFCNGPKMVENMVSDPFKYSWSTMVYGIFYILAADSLTFLPGLPGNSQNLIAATNMRFI